MYDCGSKPTTPSHLPELSSRLVQSIVSNCECTADRNLELLQQPPENHSLIRMAGRELLSPVLDLIILGIDDFPSVFWDSDRVFGNGLFILESFDSEYFQQFQTMLFQICETETFQVATRAMAQPFCGLKGCPVF